MNGSLLIKGRPYGFFSNLLHVIDNLKYCEINNLKPIINLDNMKYNSVGTNFWNKFFNNINDGVLEGTVQESDIMIINNYIVNIPSYKCTVWDACQNNSLASMQEHREDVNRIIKKYLILNEDIQAVIDSKTNEMPANLLSVQMRCTDYVFYDFNSYYNAIDSCIDNYEGIFVASDTHEAVDSIKKRYKNVYYYDTPIRTNNKEEGVLCFAVSNENLLKHATDVLIECILLSRGKKMISINSNVALTATYYNSLMDINMIHRWIGGG